ncbi:MAG: hypothetical protein WCU88_07510 [Elusimicrobiota bacterium]|jgi:hypothetical protein
MINNRRRLLLVEPRFQLQMMLRMAGWAVLATLVTAACLELFLLAAEQRWPGDFLFVRPEAGMHPMMFKRSEIALPAVAVALAVNLLLSLVATLLYSLRLAGPLHRLSQDMLRIARGEPVRRDFQLRESDELQEVGRSYDALLKTLAEKGILKDS